MSSRLLSTIAPIRRASTIVGILFCGAVSTAPAVAQQPVDRFEATVKFNDGRLVCDSGKLFLSAGYRQRLRRGLTDADLTREFVQALNRQFELMPKLYFYTLGDTADHDEVSLDKAGALHDPGIDTARHWNKGWDGFPRLGELTMDTSGFDRDLDQVSKRSGLLRYAPPDTDNLKTMPRRFEVRDVLIVSELLISPQKTIPGEKKLRDLLAPFDGLPGNPEEIQTALLNYYAGIGITPKLDLQIDRVPKQLRIVEGTRIGRLLLDKSVTADQALRIGYEALPAHAFRTFSAALNAAMAQTVEDGQKRVFDISEILAGHGQADRGRAFELPLIDPAGLNAMQQRLLTLGFQASLFDFVPDQGLVDLVVDPTTSQEGAATVAQRRRPLPARSRRAVVRRRPSHEQNRTGSAQRRRRPAGRRLRLDRIPARLTSRFLPSGGASR